MSIDIHFTEDDWQRIEHDWGVWWAGELDRPMVCFDPCLEIPAGQTIPEPPFFATNLPLEMSAEQVVDQYQARLCCEKWFGDSFPCWWPNYGPGVVAAFLGAEVGIQPDTVWFDLAERKELSQMNLQYDEDNVWFRRVLDVTRTAASRWGKQVCVGYTDIGGGLDILASLRSSEMLLLDTLDCPDQVERLAGDITKVWLRYFEDFHFAVESGRGYTSWASMWASSRTNMLQCDFSYMISPKMFERFVLPDLSACCEHLDFPFYHLDGKGQLPHLDMLLSIEKLRGIQWIAGAGQPEAADWPDVLGKIRESGKLCQVGASPEGALKIVREHGGKGFNLIIQHDQPTEEWCADFLAEIKRQGN